MESFCHFVVKGTAAPCLTMHMCVSLSLSLSLPACVPNIKMLLDPMGGIVITNDGNCILREVDVSHPTAKSMIELSRAQDEEVGDGTTSVIILAGEMLIQAEPSLRDNMHPTVIVQGYHKALQTAIEACER